MGNIRRAAVAGQFYPGSMQGLKSQIETFIDRKTEKIDAIACVLPHAGYIYSGNVAAKTLSCVNIKDRVVLLGPNHTGFGPQFSIMTGGLWQTPLGEIEIDAPLAKKILENSKYLEDDTSAHTYEHSIEVELPFLQYLKANFKIVPIIVSSDEIGILKEVGKDLANVLLSLELKNSIMLIASSDMTHYEPQESAETKDNTAIQAILELNEDRLMADIKHLNISMCGYAPTIIMLSAAKILGAKKARLVKYQTSGDVTNDKDNVVGYAGIIIY